MALKSDWNYIKRAFRTPCQNGNVSLYFETGLHAAAIALIDVATFGCREPLKFSLGRGQVKDWFGTKSRGIGNPMTHRKPKAQGSARLPSAKAGQSFFWAFEGMFERSLFYFMLAGITEEFFVNWTSMLMAANGCEGPYQGYCQFNIQPQIIGQNPTQCLIAPLPNCHGVLSDIRAVYIPVGLTATVSYHANAVPWAPGGDPPGTLSTVLLDDNTGEAWAASQQGDAASGDTGVVGWQKNLPARTAQFRKISVVGTSSHYSFITDGKLEVTLRGREVPFFTPTDCFKNSVDKAAAAWLDFYDPR